MVWKGVFLTALFVLAALVTVSGAAMAVKIAAGNLYHAKLLALEEEKNVEAASHMSAMMSDLYATHAPDPQQPMTLDFLLGAEGLRSHASLMQKGFGVVKLDLLDLNARVVWSTDPESVGKNQDDLGSFNKALAAGFASDVVPDHFITDLIGGSAAPRPFGDLRASQ